MIFFTKKDYYSTNQLLYYFESKLLKKRKKLEIILYINKLKITDIIKTFYFIAIVQELELIALNCQLEIYVYRFIQR